MIYYVIGVSGSGKTTIGSLLSKRLNLPFYDADDFHSHENIEKMKAGTPLTDDDRKDWLLAINQKAIEIKNEQQSAVFACSALKEEYRKTLSSGIEHQVKWIILVGGYEKIKQRMESRLHFMPSHLLQSQFDDFELPEYGLHLLINQTTEVMIDKITSAFKVK